MESLITLCIASNVKVAQEELFEQLSKKVTDDVVTVKQLRIA